MDRYGGYIILGGEFSVRALRESVFADLLSVAAVR